uniref:Uncharacterized protein n=1 Tax=Meloidogyne javanica TaxID=6303 RepID=A0A915M399_MELJA
MKETPHWNLTPEERADIARKFKYYHKSVRPSEEFNMLNTINGTFFRLLTQLELIDTREFEFGNSPNYLGLEFSLFVHFRDDRLQFRDLNDLPISLPDEFTPWQPRIQILPLLTTQTIQSQKSIHLNPKNGLITFVYRFSGQLFCISDIWKEPFEKYSCQFWFETELDERLQLTVIRDLRPTEQINKIGNEYVPTFGHLQHHLPSSSNSLLHHYVSSPKLSGNQQKQQKSPLFSNYKRRILSGKEDVNDERRQRAIAQLLNEMERIRNIDNDDNE